MEYNPGSNRESDFESAERVARGWFEVASTITPKLYDTKSHYQLIKMSLRTNTRLDDDDGVSNYFSHAIGNMYSSQQNCLTK